MNRLNIDKTWGNGGGSEGQATNLVLYNEDREAIELIKYFTGARSMGAAVRFAVRMAAREIREQLSDENLAALMENNHG